MLVVIRFFVVSGFFARWRRHSRPRFEIFDRF